jgi:hypothetical protein
MIFRQRLELFKQIKYQSCIKMFLQAFPGSRVLTPEEAPLINSQIQNEPEIQVPKVHKKSAKPSPGREARLRRQLKAQESFEFFDQVYSRGANDYQPPCKGEERSLCNE